MLETAVAAPHIVSHRRRCSRPLGRQPPPRVPLELGYSDPLEGRADAVAHARWWSTARAVAPAGKATIVERTCCKSTAAALSYSGLSLALLAAVRGRRRINGGEGAKEARPQENSSELVTQCGGLVAAEQDAAAGRRWGWTGGWGCGVECLLYTRVYVIG